MSVSSLRVAKRWAAVALVGMSIAACGDRRLPVGEPVDVSEPSTTVGSEDTTAVPTTRSTSPSPSDDTTPPSTADESASAPRVSWEGSEWFLLGANLPWYNWGCDFGCGEGARDGLGVSAPSVRDAVGAAFAQASDAGMNVVRWWMFPGEPWQIEAGADGLADQIDDAVYDDIDAALLLAEEHDVYLVFTLFSAPSAIPSDWLTTEDGRIRLGVALGEMFARYRDEPRILTWQLVNEPEWEIWNEVVDHADVFDLAVAVAYSVHANSDTLFSIGSANLEGLELWEGAGLDYYTAHWYDPMSSGIACAICTTYTELNEEFGLDAPVVIGEFYAGQDAGLEERLETLHSNGYAGAWAWSLLPDRTDDEMEIDLEAAAAFAARHPDVGP